MDEAIEQYQQDREERLADLAERLDRRVAWLREGSTERFDDEDIFWLEELERDRAAEGGARKRTLTDADKRQAETDLRKETDMAIKDVERYTEEATERLRTAWDTFRTISVRQIIGDEQLFREMRERFGSQYGFGEYFRGGMGATAIRDLLEVFDLDAEAVSLRETIATSKGQRHAKALKRLRVVSAFIRSDNKPSWMILEAVPVIPPELRPMVQLDGGRFATSDLNDLYRRVINRNNRLKRLLDLGAPEIIVNNEKRMLQEAVDALLDNGRRGRAVTGPGNRPLKSLSDMLKGKQGRFRQNLLGKRVDYSGRSVIVAGPELRLHQCGLPKLMALELFKPFIMSRLVERSQVQNIKAAKKLVDSMIPEVWDVLEEVIAEHPVLLNRAPTLHRLGIQAFEPVLVEGKAIQIHPLVCTAFNADFDGDQMAVHLPLSVEAQAEARILMLSSNNILSPAHGRPITVPSQDMVLGLYYLTYCRTIDVRQKGVKDAPVTSRELTELYDFESNSWKLEKGFEAHLEGAANWTTDPFKELGLSAPPRAFRDLSQVMYALETNVIDLQDVIQFREGDRLVTTAGRLVFNHEIQRALAEAIGEAEIQERPFEFQNKVFVKRNLGEFIEHLVDLYGPTAVSATLDAFKMLGFRYASRSGITISKNDVVIPPTKEEIIAKYEEQVDEIQGYFDRGEMSGEERHQAVVDLWEKATDEVADAMRDHLFRLNPIYMMANSGARGSFKQIRQLAGMRGCMTNPKGETIERPIKSNFMEGLSVLEYFISTHGARKGLADTALKTADSGYLTRRLVDVSQDVIVRERDCGTEEGIELPLMRHGAVNPNLSGRLVAGPIVDAVTGEVVGDLRGKRPTGDDEEALAEWRNRMIATADLDELAELGVDHPKALVHVRSPMKCRSAVGICAHCYGRNLGSGELCEPGDALGIIAAQSIGEPGTQLTMRTFHTGGVAGADITQGLPRVVELFEARKPKALAQVANVDGWVRIEDDESRPGTARIVIVEPVYVESDDAGTGKQRSSVGEHPFDYVKRTQMIVNERPVGRGGRSRHDRVGVPGRHPRGDVRRVPAGRRSRQEGERREGQRGLVQGRPRHGRRQGDPLGPHPAEPSAVVAGGGDGGARRPPGPADEPQAGALDQDRAVPRLRSAERVPVAGRRHQRQAHRAHRPPDAPEGARHRQRRDAVPARAARGQAGALPRERSHRPRDARAAPGGEVLGIGARHGVGDRGRTGAVRAADPRDHQGVARDGVVPVGGLLPGDHEGPDRRGAGGQGRPPARAQGERHHRQAHPGGDRPSPVPPAGDRAGAACARPVGVRPGRALLDDRRGGRGRLPPRRRRRRHLHLRAGFPAGVGGAGVAIGEAPTG